VKNFLKVS